MATPWKDIFGSLEEVALLVSDVLREMDAKSPKVVHSQAAVKNALALRLGEHRPDVLLQARQSYAENMVAHIHREWTEHGGGAKHDPVEDHPCDEPLWLADFTKEWARCSGKDDKWDLFRRKNADLMMPTADPDELERRVSQLMVGPLGKPAGEPKPKKIVASTHAAYERRPDVKAWVLRGAHGKCECCQGPAPFKRADGTPYLELHHAVMLSEGGPDTVDNAVAVCANCHRLLHHGQERAQKLKELYQQLARLVPHKPQEGGGG